MSAVYRVNPRKALEVILWLAHRQSPIDFYHILKMVYFADKYHLNIYGRPVVGDRYEAKNYGPVPTAVYDILKGDGLALQALDEYAESPNDGQPFRVEN